MVSFCFTVNLCNPNICKNVDAYDFVVHGSYSIGSEGVAFDYSTSIPSGYLSRSFYKEFDFLISDSDVFRILIEDVFDFFKFFGCDSGFSIYDFKTSNFGEVYS